MPERSWRWLRRIYFGAGRDAPLDFGQELWNWDVNVYESAAAIAQARTRSGRAFDDDDVLVDATDTLLQDVVDAAGGVEAAHNRFLAALAEAQERLHKVVAETGYTTDEPEPIFGWNFSDAQLEDAWYALEEMIIWARTLSDRLKREAHDKKRFPDQGLIPALVDGPRRQAVIAARSRLLGSYLGEVRYLSGLNLHMQSAKAGTPSARVRDGQLVLRFPDPVDAWVGHRWELTYNQGRDATSYADGLMRAVELFMDEMLEAFEQYLPARFKTT